MTTNGDFCHHSQFVFSHRLPVVSKCHFFTAFTSSLIYSSFLFPHLPPILLAPPPPPPSAGMVDVVFADVAQPDQARILALNCHHFLKNQGHFVISIKVCTHAVRRWMDKLVLCLQDSLLLSRKLRGVAVTAAAVVHCGKEGRQKC